MKILKISIVFFIISSIFTFSAFAQVEQKLVLVNPDVFKDEKAGILEFSRASRQIEIEFTAKKEELKLLDDEYLKLSKEIKQLASPNCAFISKEIVDRKINEFEQFNRKFESNQHEMKLLFAAREAEILSEININIGVALERFAKERGYVIVDLSKADGSMVISGITDVTNEFIKYYNEHSDKKTQ